MDSRLFCLEQRMNTLEQSVAEIKKEIGNLRWWILSSFIGICAVIIAFSQYQASWFQHSLNQQSDNMSAIISRLEKNSDRNWELSRETLNKIHAIELSAKK